MNKNMGNLEHDARSWQLLPHFLLRGTGFPVEWLELLAFVETATGIEALLTVEDELSQLQALVQQELRNHDAIPPRIRRTYWDRIHRGLPVVVQEEFRALDGSLCRSLDQWNGTLVRVTQRKVEAQNAFEREFVERRKVLRDIAAHPSFQEAVWLSSPQMLVHGLRPYLERWTPNKRTSDSRRVERQIMSYLQRFCAKNETASFFGPLNYGDFASPVVDETLPNLGQTRLQRREAFMAYWGVAALAHAISKDEQVRIHLSPQPNPICLLDIDAGRAIIPGHKNIALGKFDVYLLRFVDGKRSVVTIAGLAQLSVEQTWILLERLSHAHIIILRLEVPVTVLRPLEWLRNWLQDLPESCSTRVYWTGIVDTMRRIQDSFAAAPLAGKQQLLATIEALLAEVTGEEGRRGTGEFYADRLLLYEECLGSISPLHLGPICAAELRDQLIPVLDLYASHACHVYQVTRALAVNALAEVSEPEQGVPLVQFIRELRDHYQEGANTPQTPLQENILSQLRGHADEREFQIDKTLLPPIDYNAMNSTVLLTSPDILLLAKDRNALQAGDFRVVIGEIHDTLMIWGWALYFHPDRNRVEADTEHLLQRSRGTHTLANVLPSRRVKIVPFEYSGPTIEVQATSQKTDPAHRIPIAEVRIGIDAGQPYLYTSQIPRLLLYNGELTTLSHAAFALPRVVPPSIDLGAHTPRLMLGRTVIQRERWRVTRADLIDRRYQGVSFDLMYNILRSARRLHLPRYLFVLPEGERKPLFIDLYNYFSLELLDYLLVENRNVLASEMMPSLDDLWLHDESGKYCSELRTSFCYA